MKITDLLEGPYDVDPKLMPYVRMGQKIASLSPKWHPMGRRRV